MTRKASSVLGANLRGLLFSAWTVVWLELRERRLAIWRASRSCFTFSATRRISWPSSPASSAGSLAAKVSSGRPAPRANRRTNSVMAARSVALTEVGLPETAANACPAAFAAASGEASGAAAGWGAAGPAAAGSAAAGSAAAGPAAAGPAAQGPSGSWETQTGRRGLGTGITSGAGGGGRGVP